MFKGLRHVAFGAALVGVLASASAGIGASPNQHKSLVTFGKEVRLPGVSLPAGTYMFSVPMPETAWNLVQVTNKEGTKVFYTAFTILVDRPSTRQMDGIVVLGESSATTPAPIKAWYEQGERTGRQFQY